MKFPSIDQTVYQVINLNLEQSTNLFTELKKVKSKLILTSHTKQKIIKKNLQKDDFKSQLDSIKSILNLPIYFTFHRDFNGFTHVACE
jgi:hypothetical protein